MLLLSLISSRKFVYYRNNNILKAYCYPIHDVYTESSSDFDSSRNLCLYKIQIYKQRKFIKLFNILEARNKREYEFFKSVNNH